MEKFKVDRVENVSPPIFSIFSHDFNLACNKTLSFGKKRPFTYSNISFDLQMEDIKQLKYMFAPNW